MLAARRWKPSTRRFIGLDRAYRRGGLPILVRVIEQRSRQRAPLYLIADSNGRILTGNVESLEPGVLEIDGWTETPFSYQRYGRAASIAVRVWRLGPRVSRLSCETRHNAIARVSAPAKQMIVLVGRDLASPSVSGPWSAAP